MTLLKEIDSALRGAYINNIYTVGGSQLLRFRKESEDAWLVVSPRKGVWISSEVSERGETSAFTSRLRRELERAKLLGTSQVDLDRVFRLDFDGRKLIVELMPPGNVILTDETGRVVLAMEEVRSKGRRVVEGENYQPPRQSRVSPADVKPKDIKEMLARESTVGRAIGRNVALPRKYVTEALIRLGLGDASPSVSLAGREDEAARVIEDMVTQASHSPTPCICETADGDEVYVVRPTGLKVKMEGKSVSGLCDTLFLEEAGRAAERAEPDDSRRGELQATVVRLRSESAGLLARASEMRSKAAMAAGGSGEYAAGQLTDAGIKSAGEDVSPARAASLLYDKAKALERKASEGLEAAARLERRLDRMKPPAGPRLKALPKRKQEWYEKFRWFWTSGGKLAVGGRDAQSNDLLVKRHLDEADAVFHADLFGSPFFILKDGRERSELETLEVAQATVSFSSGWKTGLGAADAYWVLKDQVSTTAGSGEYLAKGSFVIRGKKNFVRHAIIQVALGLDVGGRVVAGPESAVARAVSKYVVLVPHREKPSDTAKKVLKEIDAEGAAPPPLDDVIRALPAGGGKIVRRKSGTSGQDKP